MRIGLDGLISRRCEEVRTLKTRAVGLATRVLRDVESEAPESFMYPPSETVKSCASLTQTVAELRAVQSDLGALMRLAERAAVQGEGETADFPANPGEV